METDPIFEEEQAKLSETYAKLKEIEAQTQADLNAHSLEAIGDRQDMFSQLSLDLGTGVNLETYVECESLQRIIDEYNLSTDLNAERLVKTRLLLRRPYFAKIVMQLRPGAAPRELYLGATGMADERGRHFIIDWRAPVAEAYYNQANGKTSYQANGRTIEADLLLRRQFDIDADVLKACFDTTVAIEDPLLLASLSKSRSSKLSDITATIQREQNLIVRHEDVPVLLVNGIAGSGKTSVMLQRIAYVLYQKRDEIRPDQVHLITPNAVFREYIDDVLPSMGERNPHIETWDDLMRGLHLEGRSMEGETSADDLRRIDEALETLELTQKDFKDICVDDECVIPAGRAFSAYQKFKRLPAGQHRCTLTMEELHERLEQRIKSQSYNEDVQGDLFDLEEYEQIRLFGHHIHAAFEEELPEYAERYLRDRYAQVEDAIEDGAWLKIDRIGMRLLGKESLTAAEWLYLKIALAGGAERAARYVMIDEVQDYTAVQLMTLARYFCNAHFLLLGDENQAIKEGGASFNQIQQVFAWAKKTDVARLDLLTSYRSSPEITALFKTLMEEDAAMQVASVQRPGTQPYLAAFDDDAAYREALRCQAQLAVDACREGGLAAIIVADKARAKWLGKQLSDLDVHVPSKAEALPEQGVVLLDLALAKGLEFDWVIIADAQASVYGTDTLSKHRLYTALSRATQRLSVLAQGALTPLLEGAAR